MTGLDPTRVAEITVTCGSGRRYRGSGYRVGADLVLTAAHVVEDAVAIDVRFEADLPRERTVPATTSWAAAGPDLALLRIRSEDVTPVRFARVADSDRVLAVEAVGFPWWKLRDRDDGSRYRDAAHLVGTVAVLSNSRSGTFEVALNGAIPAPVPDHSPWEGMSGAALWSAGCLIGVVTTHHPSEGTGLLSAVRLDVALGQLSAEESTALGALLPVLRDPNALPYVPTPSRARADGHHARVQEIAPEQLLDREDELTELVRFCAGTEPSMWWQAGPWAGKTALMSSFVLRPPAGVDVVSFFITNRLKGQADSAAFLIAMGEQLRVLAGEDAIAGEHSLTAFRRLLTTVAERCAQWGRRLLLVVDGLDEDASPVGAPSIAESLPKNVPPSVRLLVASRPHPGLPDGVPAEHLLRRTPVRLLSAYKGARDIERRAKTELRQILVAGGLQRDVLGLVTAAGGGLTLTDLEELTDRPRFEMEELVRGVLGRTIQSRSAGQRGPAGAREFGYLFAHETLREMAALQFGRQIAAYRDRIDKWAAGYQKRGWPVDTPAYLLRGYFRLFIAEADASAMLRLATDQARQDALLAATGGDAAGLLEIAAAATALARSASPDLGSLLTLAIGRDSLGDRNQHVPADLPGLWVRLGDRSRAEEIVRSVRPGSHRDMLWMSLMAALVAQGDIVDAVPVVDAMVTDHFRDEARHRLVRWWTDAGEWERAAWQAGRITASTRRSAAFREIVERAWSAGPAWTRELTEQVIEEADQIKLAAVRAEAAAEAGDLDAAEVLAVSMAQGHRRDLVWRTISYAAGRQGDVRRALAAARAIPDLRARAGVLEQIANQASDGLGSPLCHEILRQLPDRTRRDVLGSRLARLMSWRDPAVAGGLVEDISDPTIRALTSVTIGAVRSPQLRQLDAFADVRRISDLRERCAALLVLSAELGRGQDADLLRAEALTLLDAVGDVEVQTGLLEEVVQRLRERGLTTDPESVIEHWPPAVLGDAHLGILAVRSARRADPRDVREALARIGDARVRADARVQAVDTLAHRRLWDAAEDLALEDAETAMSEPALERGAVRTLVRSLTGGGEHARAERLIRTVIPPRDRAGLLVGLAVAVAAAGAVDEARRLARAAEQDARLPRESGRRASTIAAVARALAGRDDPLALRLARQLRNPVARAGLLAQLATRTSDVPLLREAAAVASALRPGEDRQEAFCRVLEFAALGGIAAEVLPHLDALDGRMRDRVVRRMIAAEIARSDYTRALALIPELGNSGWRAIATADVEHALRTAARKAEDDAIAADELDARAHILSDDVPDELLGATRIALASRLARIDPGAAAAMAADVGKQAAVRREDALHLLAGDVRIRGLAASGAHRRAMAELTAMPRALPFGLAGLVRQCVEDGELDLARTAAEQAGELDERIPTLCALAAALAARGRGAAAVQALVAAHAAALSIDDPDRQAAAFLAVLRVHHLVEARAGRDRLPTPESILASVLGSNAWAQALPLVARYDRGAVTALAGRLLRSP